MLPYVGIFSDNKFIVVWDNYNEVFGQIYDKNGNKEG